MKKFINLNKLKLEKSQMNGVVGGGTDILASGDKIKGPGTAVAPPYTMPLYGIKPVAFPRYAVGERG